MSSIKRKYQIFQARNIIICIYIPILYITHSILHYLIATHTYTKDGKKNQVIKYMLNFAV